MPLKIAIISSCNAPSWFIISELARVSAVELIIKPDWRRSAPRPLGRRLRRFLKSPLDHLLRRFEAAVYRRHFRRMERSMAAQLFPGGAPQLPAPPVSVAACDINSSGIRELLRRAAPDLLVVCSAPILKAEVYSLARLGALNVHMGILPRYRGQFGLFWALKHGDLEHLGVTLHWLSPQADAGPILARGYIAADNRETEKSALIKSARMAADLLREAAARLERRSEGPPAGIPQDARGTAAYRFRDRRMWHDLMFYLKNGRRRRAPASLPERREIFF